MTCVEFLEYLGSDAPLEGTESVLTEHLDLCMHCRRHLDTLENSVKGLIVEALTDVPFNSELPTVQEDLDNLERRVLRGLNGEAGRVTVASSPPTAMDNRASRKTPRKTPPQVTGTVPRQQSVDPFALVKKVLQQRDEWKEDPITNRAGKAGEEERAPTDKSLKSFYAKAKLLQRKLAIKGRKTAERVLENSSADRCPFEPRGGARPRQIKPPSV
jgi:hypothetical protein